jgi:sialic acid synthase SpsE
MNLKNFNKSTFVIAEAGINHNGSIDIAKNMIKKASESGANAIKFQTIIPDEITSKSENPDLYNMLQDWVLSKNQHIILQKFALKNKIIFFSTPFGRKSAKLLNEIKVPLIKIASGEITNHDLISYVAKMHKPIILSTGMSNISEITSAVQIIKNYKCPFAILHCISSYPTKISDTNLSTIPFLKKLFDTPIGFSDHTIGIEASLAAVSLGATIIEKHFTLDKKMDGPDQKLSLEPNELLDLTTKIREIEKSIGIPRLNQLKSEEPFQKNMRKSIAASKDITKGQIIKYSMLTFIRPAKGISPTLINEIIGRKSKNFIKKGTILQWNNF